MRVADFIDVQYGTRVMKRVERTDHANIAKYQLVAVDGSEPINPKPKVDVSKPTRIGAMSEIRSAFAGTAGTSKCPLERGKLFFDGPADRVRRCVR